LSAISPVQHFAQTIVTGGEVGRNVNRQIAVRLGLDNFESLIALLGAHLLLNLSDHRLPGRRAGELLEEGANLKVFPFDFNRHALSTIAHESAQTELRGVAVHGRTETNALDTT
jgi:hypothetical protein